MKKTSDFKSKTLLSCSASILLGLIVANPKLVKADSLPADQVTTSGTDTDQSDQLASSSNSNNGEETSPADNTEAQADSTESNTTRTADSDETNAITGTLGGLQVSYNSGTSELAVLGGTYDGAISKTQPLSRCKIYADDGQIYNPPKPQKIKIIGKVSIVGNVDYMFSGFDSLTEIEGLGNLDTSNVADISGLFYGCYSLTKIKDFGDLDTSKVTNISGLFNGCSNLTSIEGLNNLDTSNIDDMSEMFYGCSNLTSINLGASKTSKFNTSKVVSMSSMFAECVNLTHVDLSGFDVSQVEDMSCMFEGARSLVDVNLSSFKINRKNFMTFERMFADCSSLVDLDLSGFTTHKSAEVSEMFKNCTSLRSLNIKNFDLGCLSFEEMLEGVTNLDLIVLGPRTALANIEELAWDPEDSDSYLYGTVGLNVPGIWVNVGKGTIDNPEASTRWTSYELMKNRAWYEEDINGGIDDWNDEWNGDLADDGVGNPDFTRTVAVKKSPRNPNLIAETYVRMGQPVTIQYQDESGNSLKDNEIHQGRIGTNYSFSAAKISGYVLKANCLETVTGLYDANNERTITFVYTPLKSPNTSDGSNGSDSSNGSNGSNTSDSSDSSNGSNGSNTSDGSNGSDSSNGSNGSNTSDSSDSSNGSNGSNTSDGSNGSDSSNGSNGSNTSDGSNGSNDSNGSTGSIPDVPELAAPDKSNYQHHKTRQPKITETSYHKTNKLEHDMPKSKAADPELPKTGKNSVSQLLTTALGLISATSASALAWIKRKKN